MELFDIKKVYNDFDYPKEFVKVNKLGLVDYDFWYFMEKEHVEERIKGLQKRYSKRKLIPFARRGDNDDIACFDMSKPGTVQIIHDFASEGYEQREEYECFWSWFKKAIDELIENGEYDEYL